MVYAGTAVITKVAKNVLKINAPDFDADVEELIVDLATYRMEGAQDYTMHVQQTAGATAVVEVNLQASSDGTNYSTILQETGVNASGWDAVADRACAKVKILVTTVGAGNTLAVVVYATING